MNRNGKTWLKRIGVAGFIFFLLKGLMWLFFGASVINWMCNE